ncbi:SMT3/SUMO-activating complex, catalytic component UBA2 [Phaffia rhodozyma]|uniref:Ubiquitin-activating enzyme E1-like n=1 Tax=Phaffia rhodozyma TaxID=264483 RepID=A0A0F7SG24_PHARH|nr:SMT3/SUMO-activating complex, catalytic component UBA2 [Phaffia rhodozyma]
MSRHSDTISLLGKDTFELVQNTPILVVGAGGIGSELLKNLVLVGFSRITIVDLDTIDLSNLNRQFLFRKPDISKPKALVAASTAKQFNPNVDIEAHHANIKEQRFDALWFKRFGIVFGALDNMDARRHVNKMCISAGVPLLESGTAGYAGQVTPIIHGLTECFDCQTKETPKTFPVCTIRSTPSTPIHCIVWAKSYLFVQLFGEDDEAGETSELDKAQAEGENAAEIENLRKEANAFRAVRKRMIEPDGPKHVFEKVFKADIERLLSMSEMWKVPGRVKPTALDYDSILDETFKLSTVQKANSAPSDSSSSTTVTSKKNATVLKDQKQLSLKDTVLLFKESCEQLAARIAKDPSTPLTFDKDDQDTMDFVAATANLRATAYSIETLTKFKIKEMAGNIIPAIATTNAITAGLLCFQAIKILTNKYQELANVFLTSRPAQPIIRMRPQKPNPQCGVCRDVYIPIACDPSRLTLGQILNEIVKSPSTKTTGLGWGEDAKLSVFEAGRLLAEPDWDDDPDWMDNGNKTLKELGVEVGMWLTVVDEEDEEDKHDNVVFAICSLSDSTATEPYILTYPLPDVPTRPQPISAPVSVSDPETSEQLVQIIHHKRPLEDDDDDVELIEGESRAKKRKVEGGEDVLELVDDEIEMLD